jgi:hypothetical protein
MAKHKSFTVDTNVKVYFCDPQSPWQRGTNENTNGLLILLCYKNPWRQQGHRGRDRARWVAIWRRRVAIECGLCRSVRTGSASGRVVGLHMG